LFVVLGFPYQPSLTGKKRDIARTLCAEEAIIVEDALEHETAQLTVRDCLFPSGLESDQEFQQVCSTSHVHRLHESRYVPRMGSHIRACISEKKRECVMAERKAAKEKKTTIEESPLGKAVSSLKEGGQETVARLGDNEHVKEALMGLSSEECQEMLMDPGHHQETLHAVVACSGTKSTTSTTHALASSMKAADHHVSTITLLERSFHKLFADSVSCELLLERGGAGGSKIVNFHEVARVFAHAATSGDNVGMVFSLPPLNKRETAPALDPVPDWIQYAPSNLHSFLNKFKKRFSADLLLNKRLAYEPKGPGDYSNHNQKVLEAQYSTSLSPTTDGIYQSENYRDYQQETLHVKPTSSYSSSSAGVQTERQLELANENLKLQIELLKLKKTSNRMRKRKRSNDDVEEDEEEHENGSED
jgi:hypothetical protein